MANLNLWETDTTASEFVEKLTTVPDAARIFFQVVDPNDAKKGLVKGITGANLKAAMRSRGHTFVGKRRQIFANITSTPANNIHSLITLEITPSAANRLIRVRGIVMVAPISASPNNRRVAAFVRMKKGSGNWTAIDGTTGPALTFVGGTHDMQNYQDWNIDESAFDFSLQSVDTETLRFNILCKQFSGGSQDTSSNIYVNRAVNNTYAKKGSTWLEVTEYKQAENDLPLTLETITTLDSP